MSTPRGVSPTISPRGGEAGGRPLSARGTTPVIDLIPVTDVEPPAVARVLPLVPVEAARIERPSERARRTAGALQALAAYLRAVEGGRPGRAPGG